MNTYAVNFFISTNGVTVLTCCSDQTKSAFYGLRMKYKLKHSKHESVYSSHNKLAIAANLCWDPFCILKVNTELQYST